MGLGGGKGSGCWQEERLQMRTTVLGVRRTVSESSERCNPGHVASLSEPVSLAIRSVDPGGYVSAGCEFR